MSSSHKVTWIKTNYYHWFEW